MNSYKLQLARAMAASYPRTFLMREAAEFMGWSRQRTSRYLVLLRQKAVEGYRLHITDNPNYRLRRYAVETVKLGFMQNYRFSRPHGLVLYTCIEIAGCCVQIEVYRDKQDFVGGYQAGKGFVPLLKKFPGAIPACAAVEKFARQRLEGCNVEAA
jgi:hypothetical protein